jgi:hypothetical protein
MNEELQKEAALLTREIESVYTALEEQNSNLEYLEGKTRGMEGKSLRVRARLQRTLKTIQKDNRNGAILTLALLALGLFIYLI